MNQFQVNLQQFGDVSPIEKNVLDETRSLYILYGLGDGRYLRKLVNLSCVKHVLVFEPSTQLLASLEQQGRLKDLLNHPKVRLLSGSETDLYQRNIETYLMEEIDRYSFSGNFGTLMTPGAEKIPEYRPYFLKFAESLKNAINNVGVYAKFDPEDSLFGLSNFLKNLSGINKAHPVDCLIGSAQGKDAVVVAPGPSLQTVIPHLHKIRDKVILISVDSAARVLKENNLTPDIICALERSEDIRSYVEISFDKQPYYCVPSIVHPHVWNVVQDRSFIVHRDTGFDSWLYADRNRYFLGQTVSQLGLRVASILGCRTIYMAGIDCAFDPESGQSHHADASEQVQNAGEDVHNRKDFEVVEVTGYDGQPKKTYSIWMVDAQIISGFALREGLNIKRLCPENYCYPIKGVERLDPETLLSVDADDFDFSETILKRRQSTQLMPADLKQESEKVIKHLMCLKKACYRQLEKTLEFSYEYHAGFPAHRPLYRDFFLELESKRLESTKIEFNAYMGLLHNILQGEYARVGYQIHATEMDANRDELGKICNKIALYQRWFQLLAQTADRVSDMISYHLLGEKS
ncbi:MAG: motility associated factor glycosyltransferase family protein [Deltaproteobacteria bacterium]|nr:motility associated factor glycosyltransferase family protein [Deltaproteobacteria bacterium]